MNQESIIPIVILASGRGSNFEAIHEKIRDHSLKARICAVISDQPNAPVLAKAQSLGIPTVVCSFPSGPSSSSGTLEERRREHDEKLLVEIRKFQPYFLVLAGYKRVMTSFLIEAFRSDRGYSRVVNIHPSLLPAFPGLNSYAQALQYGVKITGVTIHLVEVEVDRGPICAQEAFSVASACSLEEIEHQGLQVEHRLFPKALSWILPEKFQVKVNSNGRFCVCPS